jgi:hypothetical protein
MDSLFVSYLRRMSRVVATVAVAVVAFASSACGSGRHVTFSTFSQVCGLSVPMPQGFHRSFWNSDGGGGVTISDARTGFGNPNQWPYDSNRVALAVDGGFGGNPGGSVGVVHDLRFPITLGGLERGSGDLNYWSGGGWVGTGNQKRQCGVAVWLGSGDSGTHRAAVLSALQAIQEQG